MEPILVDSSTDSESSDWDLEQYKNYKGSPVRDSATSAPNSSVRSTIASSSGTSNAGQHGSSQRPPIRKPAINGHSSHANYDSDHQLQIILSSSNNTGNSTRKLPQSLQTSSTSSRPSVRAKGVGTSQVRETHYDNARQNHVKTYMEESSSRANNDLMKENHHGSRVLPPSMRSSMSVSNAQYGGPSDLYRPSGPVDEQAVGDERHILQVALQEYGQSLTEANLPDGLLSVSLLRHQKIALAWMIQKENSSVACSGGILADDQVTSL